MTVVSSGKLSGGHTKSCGCLLIKQIPPGTVFGKLKTIKLDRVYKEVAYWFCECKCGRTVSVRGSSLRDGHSTSCGCLTEAGPNNVQWTGAGKLSGTYVATALGGARRRGICFNITAQDMWDQLEKQQFKCALTGVALVLNSKQGKYDGNSSLDRIDSTVGYEKNNIQWVHKIVNKMKLDHTQPEFIKWCNLVTDFNK